MHVKSPKEKKNEEKKKISAAHQFLEMMPQFNAKKVIYCLTVAICLYF